MTSKELAKIIGVSTATLSLVLNGKEGISQKTRAEVLAKIDELGYSYMIKANKQPEITESASAGADGADSGKGGMKSIGFVIYRSHGKLLGFNSFFPLILDGIEARARKHGYNVIIITIDKQQVQEQLHYITDANCRGFVIFGTELQEDEIPYFRSLGIPFVLFDNYYPGESINTVGVDNRQGTYIGVRHLVELGHKKIGYIRSGLNIQSFAEREFSAKRAVVEFGLEDPERFTITAGYPSNEAEAAMDQYLKDHKPEATAYLADNDEVAAGALMALVKNGYRVPEDISIVGYDDRPICEFVTPKMTSVALPRNEFGAEAVSRLIQLLEEPTVDITTIRIASTLVVRESTAKCPQ